MAKREKIVEPKKANYFASEKTGFQFVSSGCTLLDCAIGGGWVLGRMANLVGDKSTSKTALATETLINFVRQYPDGLAAYRDAEAAFDMPYAEAMGLPIARIDFGESDQITVEEFIRDFDSFLNRCLKAKVPGIYIIDSMDAVSDEAEMAADIGKGTYGMVKQKLLSTFFRKSVEKMKKANVLLLIVSQVRDNINAMFGEKHRRSGGKALDFYASQIVWLAHIKMLKKTVRSVERAYGITIKAKVKKNKVGLAFREADFDFLFAFGVDDLTANVEWLKEVGRLDIIDLKDSEFKSYMKEIDALSDADYRKECKATAKAVKKVWSEVETTFLPTRTKYGQDI